MEEQERMETGIKALRPLMISLPYNSFFIFTNNCVVLYGDLYK